jgi:hypothetical protein
MFINNKLISNISQNTMVEISLRNDRKNLSLCPDSGQNKEYGADLKVSTLMIPIDDLDSQVPFFTLSYFQPQITQKNLV